MNLTVVTTLAQEIEPYNIVQMVTILLTNRICCGNSSFHHFKVTFDS